MSTPTRRFLVKFYKPGEIFWLVRLNALRLPAFRCVELTCGLIGYGVLMQFYYGKSRM